MLIADVLRALACAPSPLLVRVCGLRMAQQQRGGWGAAGLNSNTLLAILPSCHSPSLLPSLCCGQVALFHTIGHVSACLSFSQMAVSFAHVVRWRGLP
jgi:hypothetical protein